MVIGFPLPKHTVTLLGFGGIRRFLLQTAAERAGAMLIAVPIQVVSMLQQ